MCSRTVRLSRTEVVERSRHDLLGAHVDGCDAQGACLQAAHVEQVGDQADQPVDRFVGGGEQLGAVVVVEVDVGASQAGDRGLGGGERGAQVVADGRQQRGSHAVGFGERFRGGGLRGQPLLP
nr:hypothetical protein GCM10020092_052450 [Actinoplanes digitatis]